MYMGLCDCKLNDRLTLESLRYRAIEMILDYVIDEYRNHGHNGDLEHWGHTFVNLLDNDTVEVTIEDTKNRGNSAHYIESISDWEKLMTEF